MILDLTLALKLCKTESFDKRGNTNSDKMSLVDFEIRGYVYYLRAHFVHPMSQQIDGELRFRVAV